MADITVYVEWKLPQRPRKAVSLTIPANTQVKDFLQRTVPEIDPNEILVIIDGRSVRMDAFIPSGCKIVVLPVLCGG